MFLRVSQNLYQAQIQIQVGISMLRSGTIRNQLSKSKIIITSILKSCKTIMEKEAEFDNKQSLYRKADRIKGYMSDSFDFRFDSLKQSLVNAGFAGKIKGFGKWKLQSNHSIPKDPKELQDQLPINTEPDFKCSSSDRIKYTWIGHSTAVINLGNRLNIIIDPVFSDRCSPYQWLGPQRFRKPACQIKDLPKIDLVLISHDHYDHLDENSIKQIEAQFQPHYMAGLQSGDVLPKDNQRVHEMDWTDTQKITINGQELTVTFVPVCHWGRRGTMDLNKRLWGGFVIETSDKKKIFYSGDTGYCPVFKEIGEKFGPFDLCVLPIGAYEPREFLRQQHVNPEQAVTVHQELKSKKSVGVHWGTFPLGNEHWCQARKDLKEAVQKKGIKEGEFITVGHGNSFEI